MLAYMRGSGLITRSLLVRRKLSRSLAVVLLVGLNSVTERNGECAIFVVFLKQVCLRVA